MNSESKKNGSISEVWSKLIQEVIFGSLIFIFLGFTMTYNTLKAKPEKIKRISNKKAIVILMSCFFVSAAVLYFTTAHFVLSIMSSVGFLIAFWLFGFASTSLLLIFINRNFDKNRITKQNLEVDQLDFERLIKHLENPDFIPVGISLRDQQPILIPVKQVREHSLTSGATGQGKTTLLKTKVQHFIKHNRPIIIIDPKGEKSDVDLVKNIAKQFGRENDFKLFSLSFPLESDAYNPLKVGTSLQKKDKLMSGLEITHEYYGSKADEFLGAVFDAITYLNKELDLWYLHQILIDKNVFSTLENELRDQPETDELLTLLNQMSSARKISDKDLSGLTAQIGSLNSLELRSLLTKKTTKKEIDLVEVLQNNQIAYFQLNVNAYQKIAKKIGKLIVQDLRLVSNIFQSEQVKKKFDTAICFIDEFGSFATPDFSDFLKMARSSGIGCDLFFQGIADLNTVSREFAEQVLGNTVTKFILRQDINSDVETWASMAGTDDSRIESYQTEYDPILGIRRTGMGNIHDGKKMIIDFDVFKQLRPGRSVFIDKARHINDVIAIWNISNNDIKPIKIESTDEIRNNFSVRKYQSQAKG